MITPDIASLIMNKIPNPYLIDCSVYGNLVAVNKNWNKVIMTALRCLHLSMFENYKKTINNIEINDKMYKTIISDYIDEGNKDSESIKNLNELEAISINTSHKIIRTLEQFSISDLRLLKTRPTDSLFQQTIKFAHVIKIDNSIELKNSKNLYRSMLVKDLIYSKIDPKSEYSELLKNFNPQLFADFYNKIYIKNINNDISCVIKNDASKEFTNYFKILNKTNRDYYLSDLLGRSPIPVIAEYLLSSKDELPLIKKFIDSFDATPKESNSLLSIFINKLIAHDHVDEAEGLIKRLRPEFRQSLLRDLEIKKNQLKQRENDLKFYENLKIAVKKNDLEAAIELRGKIDKSSQDLLEDSYFLIRDAKKLTKEPTDQGLLEEVKKFYAANPSYGLGALRGLTSIINKIQDPDLQMDAWEFCALGYVNTKQMDPQNFRSWMRRKDKREASLLPKIV